MRQRKPNELAEEASAELGAALLFQLSPERGEGEKEGWNLPLRAWKKGARGDLDSTVTSGWSADRQLTGYLKRLLC